MSASLEPSQPIEAMSVSELLAGAGRALAVAGPGECWVTGTLSGWRTSKAYGWGELVQHSAYGRSQVARVPIGLPWSVLQRAAHVLARSGVELADGLEVRVFGALEIGGRYAPLRLVVSALDHRTSVGSVVVARRELLAALEEDGSIDQNRATTLGPAPLRIGLVVPASGGAGHGDFVGRLRSSAHPWQIRELRVAMEGPSAPADIAGPSCASGPKTSRSSRLFAAGVPPPRWPPSMPRLWPGPSPAARSPWSWPWAMPAIAAWPTWWPTPRCRHLRQPPPGWWSAIEATTRRRLPGPRPRSPHASGRRASG